MVSIYGPLQPVLLRAAESGAAITVSRDGHWAFHRSEREYQDPRDLIRKMAQEIRLLYSVASGHYYL